MNNGTFPTMHFLHKAQWPFAAVCTPIFSRSELRPPSRSSIVSVFLLTVEAFGAEELPLLPLSTPSSSGLLSTHCCCGGGGKSSETFFYFVFFFFYFSACFIIEAFMNFKLQTPSTYRCRIKTSEILPSTVKYV